MGYPSIYPTGVTIYNKEKAYSGYTIFPSAKGALLQTFFCDDNLSGC